MSEQLLKCPDHPRYKALRKPRCGCVRCWEIYLLVKKTERELADQLRSNLLGLKP